MVGKRPLMIFLRDSLKGVFGSTIKILNMRESLLNRVRFIMDKPFRQLVRADQIV
jgi:hypothetical protein